MQQLGTSCALTRFLVLQVVHDYHNSLRLYPRLADAFYSRSKQDVFHHSPGLHGGYLTEVAFMLQYHKYTFLFSVEFDARLIGHWGSFFNASLLQADQSRGVDLWSGHDSHLTAEHAANLTGPGRVDHLWSLGIQ